MPDENHKGPWLESAKRRLRDIINDECIYRVPPGSHELPWKEGRGWYGWQFYLRKACLDPDALLAISHDFWSRYRVTYEARPFQIAGVEAAAAPIITAIVMRGLLEQGIRLNAFTIRKERKAYGLHNLIEGQPSDLPVFFIDDLTSAQHDAFWHFVNVVRDARLPLNGLGYVLVRKAERAGGNTVIDTSIGCVAIESMFTLDDFDMSYSDYHARRAA